MRATSGLLVTSLLSVVRCVARTGESRAVLVCSPGRHPCALDEDLTRFPHVNRERYAEALCIPDFNAAMRQALLDVLSFDWRALSPAIRAGATAEPLRELP